MAKFRLKWQRYFDLYDVNTSVTDGSPGLSYSSIPFHQILNFKRFKKFSNKNLFPPKSNIFNNINHTITFKHEESKYNYDLVFSKLYDKYYDFDFVMKTMIYDRVQYVPLVTLFYDISLFYRVDCYVSLCKNWNEFISDSFLEFYNNFHKEYSDLLGTSYYTYFDSKMTSIFYKNYIKNRDLDDEDLKNEFHRLSWLHQDELSYDDNISSYSNYTRSSAPLKGYIKDKDLRMIDQLHPHLVSSPEILNMF